MSPRWGLKNDKLLVFYRYVAPLGLLFNNL
jgi:hypothetical protein